MKETLPESSGISGERLRIRYDSSVIPVIDGESILIPTGKITALIGPNGSGKSTLLKALARQLVPENGQVIIDGREIATLSSIQLARKLGILFQENLAPNDLSVEELVFRGRHPHRRLFESLTKQDSAAVDEALKLADLTSLRYSQISELSSGQRQLAWIAMAVAQEPRYLFFDEPTTFLDLAHQFDVIDLVLRLNRELSKTIVLVVHDLNIAARYADHIFAMKNGQIISSGTPFEVLTVETLRQVFDVETRIVKDEDNKIFFCVPIRKTTKDFR